jgi:hypothetical protein
MRWRTNQCRGRSPRRCWSAVRDFYRARDRPDTGGHFPRNRAHGEDYGPAMLAEVLSRYAGKDAPAMLPEIQKWSLLQTIAWTLEISATRRGTAMEHVLAEITRVLAAPTGQQRYAV